MWMLLGKLLGGLTGLDQVMALLLGMLGLGF